VPSKGTPKSRARGLVSAKRLAAKQVNATTSLKLRDPDKNIRFPLGTKAGSIQAAASIEPAFPIRVRTSALE